MNDTATLTRSTARPGQLASLADLAAIPEEEIWLASQKSARTRRAYKQDVAHFMRTLDITSPEQLRLIDHRAVIAWERIMREEDRAAASTVRRRLAALSSLFKHLVRHGAASRNPVVDVSRPAINREEGSTAAFSKVHARQLLDAPPADTVAGLRDRAILSVGLQVGLRRAEIASLTVGDLHQNRGYDALRLTRKGGRWDALAINPQAWTLSLDQTKVLVHLTTKCGLDADDKAVLAEARTTAKAYEALKALATRTAPQEALFQLIGTFREQREELHAIDIISKKMPKFMYFSHWDRMSGELSINQLNVDKQHNREMSSGDRVFLDFLEYAGTTLDELVATNQFEELNAKCEAAALRITNQIFDYWTQNDELKIKVVLSEGKPGDPALFNAGPVARARVENNLHGVTVPFSERSAGFIWFFSFLVKFAQIKKSHGNVILLLDEPGLTLHGTAQLDLLRYFAEEIAPHHQLIWTTHSPFMVPPDNLACVRTVEDVVVRDQRGRKKSIGTKIRSDVLTTDPQTNFPIFGAMGFEVTQTLVIGKNTLLVEGPSDILYLQAASAVLKAAGRRHLAPQWAICPSGGIDKILPFVRLFYGNKLNVAVLTDFERGQKRKLEELHKSALLEQERIILATEIAGKEEADIEDFFEPAVFIDLVNKTYQLSDEHQLTIEKLDQADGNTQRLVKKAEAYFRLLPVGVPEFSHFDPSMYLLQHPELLKGKGKAVQATLDRFEAAFERISKFAA